MEAGTAKQAILAWLLCAEKDPAVLLPNIILYLALNTSLNPVVFLELDTGVDADSQSLRTQVERHHDGLELTDHPRCDSRHLWPLSLTCLSSWMQLSLTCPFVQRLYAAVVSCLCRVAAVYIQGVINLALVQTGLKTNTSRVEVRMLLN